MFTWNPDTIRYVRRKNTTTGETEELIFGEGTASSGDTLPTEGVYNGATVLIDNQSKVKVFDMETSTWRDV